MKDHAPGGRVLSPGWVPSWPFDLLRAKGWDRAQGWGLALRRLRAGGGHPTPTPPARETDVIWHEVECGAYATDLELWEELTEDASGPILELGCGTGRLALHLAGREHEVIGVDLNAPLVAAFNERARNLPAQAEVADARSFNLGKRFGLIVAPMQLIQLLGNEEERIASLSCAARHLRPGGLTAVAIVEGSTSGTGGSGSIGDDEETPRSGSGIRPPLPDVREVDGWVYSSLPLETVVGDGEIVVRRLRQTVSPQGNLNDEVDEVRLRALSAAELEREAEAAGLRPAGRRAIPATDAHVGSTVVLLERGV